MLGLEKLKSFVDTAFGLAEEQASEDAVLGVVMLIMEVRDRETDSTAWYTYCTDRRQWVQDAAIREAGEALAFSEFEEVDEPDDDH